MTFAAPWMFALLLLAPLAICRWLRPRRRGALRFGSLAEVGGTPAGLRVRLVWMLPALRIAAVALAVVALARPREGVGRTEVSTEAVAMQLVVDRSPSMARGIRMGRSVVTRLDAVKAALNEFILGSRAAGAGRGEETGVTGRSGDLLGLVSFARFAETVCPLVTDHKTLNELVQQMTIADPRSFEDGTAIGDAVALAAARLQRTEQELGSRGALADGAVSIKSKVIVLLTDGDDNASETPPLEAAAIAADWGIKLYVIGIDSAGGFERVLSRMAESTGGIYRSVSDADSLIAVYEEIGKLEKTTVETASYTDYQERFEPWAWAAAATLALELLLASVLLRRTW